MNPCPRCGKPKDREGYYCSKCLDKKNAYNRESWAFFRQQGLCSICGKVKVYGDEVNCPECRAKRVAGTKPKTEEQRLARNEWARNHKKIVYMERKNEGICTRCGRRKVAALRTKCPICLDKCATESRLARLG